MEGKISKRQFSHRFQPNFMVNMSAMAKYRLLLFGDVPKITKDISL